MTDYGFLEMKLHEYTHVFPRLSFLHVPNQTSHKLYFSC
jgi:hypothetical protein